VLYNGRFSLPAGRYRIELAWNAFTAAPQNVGLQVGRIGPPWRTWLVHPESGARWSDEFDLPVDMNFIGVRGTPDLERAVQWLTISPIAVVDEHARPQTPPVLGVRQYGDVAVLAHEEAAEPEPTGFWTMGRQHTPVTFVREREETPLTLRVRNGPEPNHVRLAATGWLTSIDLEPGATREVAVPLQKRVLTVDIETENGFDPRKYDASSQDKRLLGVWIEISGLAQ
jgi:hypothetical protein